MSTVKVNGPRSSSSSSAHAAQTAAQIDLLISLHLHSWSALALAVQNQWGGPTSNDKRDWLAGAISDLLASGEVNDADELEEVLIQVMLDEFEVVVDDGSAAEIAASLVRDRQRILQGNFSELENMFARWEEKQKRGPEKLPFKMVAVEEDDNQDTDWDSSVSEGEDVEMHQAPQLVPATRQENSAPEVDEDGFTKVLGKKKQR